MRRSRAGVGARHRRSSLSIGLGWGVAGAAASLVADSALGLGALRAATRVLLGRTARIAGALSRSPPFVIQVSAIRPVHGFRDVDDVTMLEA
jgi:hypothetical protein